MSFQASIWAQSKKATRHLGNDLKMHKNLTCSRRRFNEIQHIAAAAVGSRLGPINSCWTSFVTNWKLMHKRLAQISPSLVFIYEKMSRHFFSNLISPTLDWKKIMYRWSETCHIFNLRIRCNVYFECEWVQLCQKQIKDMKNAGLNHENANAKSLIIQLCYLKIMFLFFFKGGFHYSSRIITLFSLLLLHENTPIHQLSMILPRGSIPFAICNSLFSTG